MSCNYETPAPIDVGTPRRNTKWVNRDVLAHSATARNGDWDVMIAANKTATLVLKKPGTVDYYCKFHPNIKARIAVEP